MTEGMTNKEIEGKIIQFIDNYIKSCANSSDMPYQMGKIVALKDTKHEVLRIFTESRRCPFL